MCTILKYIHHRVKKLQKSQKAIFCQAVLRIILTCIVGAVLILWICWTYRSANPDNTETIIVSGNDVSLTEFTSQADSVDFVYGDKEYSVHWRGYGGMGAHQAVTKLAKEKEIEVMVLRESAVAVAVRSEMCIYLDVEEYNQWHNRNKTIGIVSVSALCVLFVLVFSNNVFRYLKLDRIKYFDKENADEHKH